MPKDKQIKTKKIKELEPEDDIALKVVDDVDEDDEVHAKTAGELDPEILEALNNDKRKKKPAVKEIDYIPELERGDTDLEASFGNDF